MKKNLKIIITIVTISLLFFLIIAFDITPYLRGPSPYPPEWRWTYYFVNTINKVWLPLIIILVILIIGFYSEKRISVNVFKNVRFVLVLLVILSFLFQISVLYFSRSGVTVLFHRIANPELNGYFTASLNIPNLSDFLREYNRNVLNFTMHARGHPPGGILLFWSINKIVSFAPSLDTIANQFSPTRNDVKILWDSLSVNQRTGALVSSFIIPFLSSIAVVPLYFLGKYLYGSTTALRSVILYIFVPSVTLFTPLFDTLFPFFSIIALYLFLKGLQRKPAFFFLSGFILSLGIFFSLSLLPVVLLIFLFTFLKFIVKKTDTSLKKATSFVFFLLGVVFLPIILFLFFHFNFLEVGKTIVSGLAPRSYTSWVFYNLYDFFIFSGIPVLIIFILLFWRFLNVLLRRSWGKFDYLLAAFLCTLILLDISGISRAETARIWLPLIPFLILLTTRYFTKDLKFSTYAFLTIALLEAIQVLFFQEFWVTLW